jgi:hypothetical protein
MAPYLAESFVERERFAGSATGRPTGFSPARAVDAAVQIAITPLPCHSRISISTRWWPISASSSAHEEAHCRKDPPTMGTRGSSATPAKRLATGPVNRGTPGANPTSPWRNCFSARAARSEKQTHQRAGNCARSSLTCRASPGSALPHPGRETGSRSKTARTRKGSSVCLPLEADRIDEEITVELRLCPRCGGTQFKDQSEIEQMIGEISPIVPKIMHLRT